MKKLFILSFAALIALSACSKKASESQDANSDEIEFTIGATIDNSKTVFVPNGGKVFWATGDQLGVKYTKTSGTVTKADNISMTLIEGAGTPVGTFSGKRSQTSALPDGQHMMVYYPKNEKNDKVFKCVEDTLFLGTTFPKIQNTADILFDPNLMYGVLDPAPSDWPTTSTSQIPLKVTMYNAMSVIDFTLKGEGSVKRLFLTDLDTKAPGMHGDYEVAIIDNEVKCFPTLPSGKNEYDRTIIAEFNKPIVLSATGVHAYITVFPRDYKKGIEVGLELTDGTYMIKKLDGPLYLESNAYYSAPELSFSNQQVSGKGICENTVYSYQTFTDKRDNEVYRYITVGSVDWMIDNLRYLPEDYNPSNNANDICIKHDGTDGDGIWYPVVMNAAGNGVVFGTADDVKKVGYLYNCSLAVTNDETVIVELHKQVAEKTKTAPDALTELKAYEGKQGICPDGWTIPTLEQYQTFCEACGTDKAAVNASALAIKGFSLRDFGYLAIASISVKYGTLQNYVKNKLNMTEMVLSTPYSYTQYWAAQFVNTTNVATPAKVNDLSGCAVRCVRAPK